MITIQIQDRRWKALLRPYCKTVREMCGAALSGVGCRVSGIGLTVVLADDAFVRELNKTYRGQDKPTNVLSFPSLPDTRHPIPDTRYLGDIVLARQTIEREAREQAKTVRDHAAHLLVHGTLHLLGYDHMRKKEAEEMEAIEIKVLKKLGINNPYL